jgi:hypothetical protein
MQIVYDFHSFDVGLIYKCTLLIKPQTLNYYYFMFGELFFHKYDFVLFCEMVLIGVMLSSHYWSLLHELQYFL